MDARSITRIFESVVTRAEDDPIISMTIPEREARIRELLIVYLKGLPRSEILSLLKDVRAEKAAEVQHDQELQEQEAARQEADRIAIAPSPRVQAPALQPDTPKKAKNADPPGMPEGLNSEQRALWLSDHTPNW
jgi:hypothetical protein